MALKSYVVVITKFVAKQAERVPPSIREALLIWREAVDLDGLPDVRKSKGYHDEALKGRRSGQRSVRLNQAFRIIYEESERGDVVVVGVQEINKHEY